MSRLQFRRNWLTQKPCALLVDSGKQCNWICGPSGYDELLLVTFNRMMSTKTDRVQNPQVNFPPPTLFIMAGLGGWIIELAVPLPLSSVLVIPAQTIFGWSVIIPGAALLVGALATFAKVKTAVYPNQPARQLVAHGPYRFSRNPMYLALTAIMVGVGLLADNLWMFILLPLVLFVLTKTVIQREENYLADAFGESYRDYQARVRRWF